MTRVEEAALEAYPKEDGRMWHSIFGTFEFDRNAGARKGYQEGYEQAEKDLGWHSVKESLPPMDKEVIVLTDVTNGKYIKGSHMICFGHIVDKTIAISYDGWNIPGVTHWMYLPELKE